MSKITHFHFETTRNIGDQAHVLAIQDAITERANSAGRSVEFTSLPIEFLKYHQVPPVVPGYMQLPAVAHRLYREFKFGGLLSTTQVNAMLKAINRTDMVVIGGGGVYIAPLLPFDTHFIERITVPIVVYGAGYNQNTGVADLNPAQKESVRLLGRKAKLQGVRDEGTRDFLSSIGVQSDLIGDPAMFLQGQGDVARAPRGKKRLVVGLNIAAHGWSKQAELLPSLVKTYAQFAKAFAAEHPEAQFMYCMHYPNESQVVDMLRAEGVQIAQVIQGDARHLKQAYEGMDLVVSMMLHASILAFGAGTPVISVGYDVKNESFMELTGQRQRFTKVSNVTPAFLLAQANDVCANRPAILKDLRQRKDAMQQQATAFADAVVALLPKN
jgi:polysaccharide pyruvyl transferase WcaK-like protein